MPQYTLRVLYSLEACLCVRRFYRIRWNCKRRVDDSSDVHFVLLLPIAITT